MADRLDGLSGKPGFQSLTGSELALVSTYAGRRSFAAGHVIMASGTIPDLLYVLVSGSLAEPSQQPVVFDAPALLFGRGVRKDVVAGPDGANALVLTRQHVFTIARECPDFIIDLLRGTSVDPA